MIICFNGIDGSGKSFQAQWLVKKLRAEGYPAIHIWTGGRRTFRRPLIWLGKRLLRSRRRSGPAATGGSGQGDYQSYRSSMNKLFRYGSLRTLWLHLSLLEHALEIWAALLPHLLRGRIIICDRYLHDSILRLAVLAGMEVEQFSRYLRLLALYPVPQPTVQFWIDVPAAVAMARKDDIPDLQFLERRIPFYRQLAEQRGMQVIDGDGELDEIRGAIWEQVSAHLPARPEPALEPSLGAMSQATPPSARREK